MRSAAVVVCVAALAACLVSWSGRAAAQPGEKLLDLGKEDLTIANVRIRLVRADQAKFFFRAGEPSENYFRVVLRVENTDKVRKVEYTSWTATASLGDEHDNDYARIRWPAEDAILGDDALKRKDRALLGRASIYPGKAVEDILLFQRPVTAAKKLVLTLPYRKRGEAGLLKVRVRVPLAFKR
jgi:hypothetical protein